MTTDYQAFFGRKSEEVAKDMLGRFLVRNIEGREIVAQVIETGAYEKGKEIASRNGMKYAPGTIFLMPFRGHYFFNVATDKPGFPSCVEIRKVLTDQREIGGAAAVTKFLKMPQTLDGVLLENEMQIIGEPADASRISTETIGSDNCLGYFYLR